MKTLKDYLVESETWMHNPAEGDAFGIELSDGTLVESYILELADDSILLDATPDIMRVLESWNLLSEQESEDGVLLEMGYGTLGEEELDEINRRGFLGLMGAGLGAAALAGLPNMAQAGQSKINPEARCRMCRLPYQYHFNFDPPNDPNGKITSTKIRSPCGQVPGDFPDLYQPSSNTVPADKSTSATTPVIEPTTQPNFYIMKAGSNNTTYWIYGTRQDPECTRPIAAIFKGRPVTVMVNPKISSNNEARGYILSSSIREDGTNDHNMDEAKYHGREVPLGKPMAGDVKKSKVYVRDPATGNIKKVNFGDPNMRIKKTSPAHRKSFRARHHCENPGPRTKARYWSCRAW